MPMALIYILLLTGINMTLKKTTKLVFDYFFCQLGIENRITE